MSQSPSPDSRIRRSAPVLAAAAVAALVLLGWHQIQQPAPLSVVPMESRVMQDTDFDFARPLPTTTQLNGAKVALGQKLFHDPRLSKDNTVSCASCHALSSGGVDRKARSVGVAGGVGSINAPTVFNSGENFVQFWDGRAPSLEAQIDGPVSHPLEMASTWAQVLEKLASDTYYTKQFAALYDNGLNANNIKDAIATFERSLITPNSRFDKFLKGDLAALNPQETRGYALFQSYGCASCHQGRNLGGNMFEKMGLMADYFADRGQVTEADRGRFNVTKDVQNLYEFRVPTLRNIALTAPYFHDGRAQTLEQAILIMTKYQLGRPMPVADVDAIAAFLRTLTGEYLGEPL